MRWELLSKYNSAVLQENLIEYLVRKLLKLFWRTQYCPSFYPPIQFFFLGGNTCCAFDCTPNVDTAIEDKIRDRQKATLQATRVIHACRKESLFFLQTNWTMS
jgi:hypothetical protein